MKYTEEYITWFKNNIPKYTCFRELHNAFNEHFNLNSNIHSVRSALCERGIKPYPRLFLNKNIDWVKNNIKNYTSINELRLAFNKQYNLEVTLEQFSNYLNRSHIVTGYVNTSRLPTFWTEDKKNWIRENAKYYKDQRSLRDAFNKQFNCNVTLNQLAHNMRRYNIKYNKVVYTDQVHYPGRNYYAKPIGSERKVSGRKTLIKFQHIRHDDEQNYKLKHVYLYEQYNNTTVNDDELVVFIDNNSNNFAKENLYKIPKNAQALIINMIYNYSCRPSLLLVLWCMQRVQLNRLLKQNNTIASTFIRNKIFKEI